MRGGFCETEKNTGRGKRVHFRGMCPSVFGTGIRQNDAGTDFQRGRGEHLVLPEYFCQQRGGLAGVDANHV